MTIASEVKKDLTGTRLLDESNIQVIKDELLEKMDAIGLSEDTFLHVAQPERVFKRLFEDFELIEAAGGLVRKDDRYLFIKRNGFWDIPKGKLEEGESPAVAGAREVEEECGVAVDVRDLPFCETYHTYYHKGQPVLKKTYWYEYHTDQNQKLVPQTEEGITEVQWVGRAEWGKIHQLTFSSISEVLYQYEKKVLSL